MKIWFTLHHETATRCSMTINVTSEEEPLRVRVGKDGTISYVFSGLDITDLDNLKNRLGEIVEDIDIL